MQNQDADEAKAVQQNRLPPGWRLTQAPDFGYFIQPGGTAGRIGEFAATPQECVDCFLTSGKAVPVLREDIWIDDTEVKYIDPKYLVELPEATPESTCPHCGADCPFDYDNEYYVGCTPARLAQSILAITGLKPKTTSQEWVEVWNCGCGWRYKMDNCR